MASRYEYPIINVDAENEHFNISDSVISWMESCKSMAAQDVSSKELLIDSMPPPAPYHELSAPGLAWNMVRIFSEKQGLSRDIIDLTSAHGSQWPQDFNNEGETTPPRASTQEGHSVDELSKKISQVRLMSRGMPTSYVRLPDGSTNEQKAKSHSREDTVENNPNVRMRGNDEWAPPRAQIIFNIHEETSFRKVMQRQNYRCSGCGTKIDLELARRLVLYCHYLGKYFCKCCFSHKAIHLPGYILQKWDFHKYSVSHFALQFLDRIANEPLFNIDDINPALYRKVKKLKSLIDIRMQLYYLRIYISTCPLTDKLNGEYTTFTHQHLLQDDVHLYSLNNLIEIQHGKLYEYLNDLVTRSIAHIAQCDRCRAKGHYCQLCGPSSLMSSMILNNQQVISDQPAPSNSKLRHSNSLGQGISAVSTTSIASKETNQIQIDSRGHYQQQNQVPVSSHSRSSSGNYASFSTPSAIAGNSAALAGPVPVPANDHELIFPFEIGRVAQCRACGCCFHLQCFIDAEQNCPKCERIQRRRAEEPLGSGNASGGGNDDHATKNEQAASETVTTSNTNTIDMPKTPVTAT